MTLKMNRVSKNRIDEAPRGDDVARLPHQDPKVGSERDLPDPDKVLWELKQRHIVLSKLIEEGNAPEEVRNLKELVEGTISELEEIIKNGVGLEGDSGDKIA